jgi:predicted ribosomally synthesized peptide with SipW-like signal peptide
MVLLNKIIGGITMKKKFWSAIVLTLAAVALVVSSVLVTVAYLTASSGVSNVFTVGNVSITMFETKVDADGEPVKPYTEVDANSYHLMPGKTYTKDPTIRITSKLEHDSMFLFVKSNNHAISTTAPTTMPVHAPT